MEIIKKYRNFFSKILLISGNDYKLKFLKILSLSFVLSLMEFIGISVLVSFVLFLFGENELNISSFFNLEYFTKMQLIYSIFIIYTAKIILSVFSQIKINNYLFSLHYDLSKKLLNSYLKKAYSFFVETNSSILVRNIYTEIGVFTYQIVLALTILINDLLLISFLFFLLLINDLGNTIIITFIFLLFYFAYYYISKPYLRKWGETLSKQKFLVHNDLKETFNSIKEIKVFGNEDYFIKKFEKNFYKYSSSSRNQNIISHFPKLFFEYLLVVILVLLILFFNLKNVTTSDIFASLTLFTAVSLRLVPSIARLSAQIQGIIFYKTTVDILYDEMVKIKTDNSKENIMNKNIKKTNLKFDKFLNIKNLSFSYKNPKNEKKILKDINVQLNKNNIIGIFGPSGGGKTTFIDIIVGLLEPHQGEILVDGEKNLNDENTKTEWIKKVGYVTQKIYLLNDTIKQNIFYESGKLDNDKFNSAIEQSQFDKVINSYPNKENTIISENGGNFSGGQIKRLALARALYRDPDLLIMDETTSSLDSESEDKILSNLVNLKNNKLIIIISHDKRIFKYCDKVFKLENGKLTLEN